MDGADQHFLAAAAFAFDQHRRMAARGLGGNRKGSAEGWRGADHRFEIGAGRELLGQRSKLVLRCFASGRGAQGLHQPVRGDGLHQIVSRACTHGFHRQQRRGAGGQHQDRQSRAARLELGDQRAGIIAGHPLVENDGVKLHALPRAQHGNGCFGISCDKRAPALARGERRDQPTLGRLIINQHEQSLLELSHHVPVFAETCCLASHLP